MRIFQSTSADPSRGLGAAVGNIQELAEQVICYSEDMEYLPNRSDLMRLPAALLPSPALQLGLLPCNNKDMQDSLRALADRNGFSIELNQDYLGPQIIWLQGGGILTKDDRLAFYVILPRPKSKDVNLEVLESTLVQEPLSKGRIYRPVDQGQFVQTAFQCQVGDIIILERGEKLWIPREGNIEHHGVCLLSTLFLIH
ncbi:hypothetical protein V8C35DRAFT_307545 [Trichoderma chlorosporum]